ncbi:hypothetical protein PHYBOEH_000570 [Phytophthora boehmeriae]|uniref:LNR domain-containing protein n=1 Tax=Phytophthora boehmeriae TaxID=109152 RepID=A0A8T1X5P6_9STRA|nr:hypothetical protein PHYBOEH_000570 [Phytophthora boehmeriae]
MSSMRSRRGVLERPPSPSERQGHSSSFLLFLLFVLTLFCAFFLVERTSVDRSNIGNVPSQDFLSYGPIDVVYTWVNGTDPRWKTEKEFWHKHWIASLTGQPLPVWGQDAQVKGKDDSNSDNRFRDNEELRYSLRSLEKYAPWVRHIYVVTDGQIPSWLDIESPKISIVKHRDIFANESHLPVFSSPAIEWNLDNIPGLSDMFLYFNDDVFLGSPIRPEDFVSQAGVQKVYFAWEIPLCSNRCWDTYLANGRCDKECNVTACDFDMGDCGCDVNPLDGSLSCDAEKVANILENTPKPLKIAHHLCQGTCNYHWLGNGVCDRTCNVSSCAYDGGDCRERAQPAGRHGHFREEDPDKDELSPLVRNLWSADVSVNHTLVQVPLDVNASYLNFTEAFGGANGSIWSAAHDNADLIRFASVHEKENVLLLVFGRDSVADPMTSSASISVVGEDPQGTPIQLDFSIIRGEKIIETSSTAGENSFQDEGMTGGMFTFQNTSTRPQNIRLPFGFRQATVRSILGGGVKRDDTITSEDGATMEADIPLELSMDGGIEAVVELVADKVPLVEVFLPFNVTGKKLQEGDVINLGWYMNLRLHDDDDDWDWNDQSICQLEVPKKKSAPAPANASSSDVKEGTDIGEIVQGSATKEVEVKIDIASNMKDDEHANGENVQEEVVQEENTEAEGGEESDAIPKCRLAEDNCGIIVTLRVITHHVRTIFSEAGVINDDEGEKNSEGDSETDSSQSAGSSSSPTQDDADLNGKLQQLIKEWKTSPQVTDGQICFYDTDRADPWRYRYCFAIAMGHFQTRGVDLVHQPTLYALMHPPKPKVVYTPYMGDDPALLELLDRCIDTTRRLIGFRPRMCYPNEVPVPRPVKDSSKVDTQAQKEEEGRRLACEAQQRRLAQREQREKEELEAEANKGIFGRFLESIKSTVGLSHVEPADESLDDVEYEDVCAPAPVKEEKPPVTLKTAQALLSKDTFGDSLRFVNKLYNRAFGKAAERRRVPSHMPFLLQKSIIREIKDHWTTEPEKREKVREIPTAEGTVRLSETLTPYITLENLQRCPSVADALVRNVRYESKVELMSEKEVTFHMLSDNYKFAWKQMMGTRARRTKFVCINDDMKYPSTSVSQILHELFLSIWPKRSQFELPFHLKNRYAHIDEYHAAQTRRHIAAAIFAFILLLVALVFRSELRALFGFQDIARARAASASQLTQDFEQAQQQEEELEHGSDDNSKEVDADAEGTSKKKRPARKGSN